MTTHAIEVAEGKRFQFGKNWERFLKVLSGERILAATNALSAMLGLRDLHGCRFLDVGSGSGLSSLAAHQLGAEVVAFDYDPTSVACTEELRRRYAQANLDWRVQQGSALDKAYLATLGQFDVVYSWGVLHHSGAMWPALENMVPLVRDGGRLFIAIYNDQGETSRRWLLIKQIYNQLPAPLAIAFGALVMGVRDLRFLAGDLLKLRPGRYIRRWTQYATNSLRGMSRYHDMIDWVGGLPFEVAKPEAIILFFQARGFKLVNLRTCGGGHGCNEFVFVRCSGLQMPVGEADAILAS